MTGNPGREVPGERCLPPALAAQVEVTAVPLFRLRLISPVVALISLIMASSAVLASTPGADVRLTNDNQPVTGYLSADQIAGVSSYTDATLQECSRSRGRQNEPSVAIDPRNDQVIVGSSNDYCAVYNNGNDADGAPIPSGPIWLGYYRSDDGGSSFQSSLVPGYPGDTSSLGALAKIRTASAGDPVLAWDADGRLFMGSESSDDPAGSKKTFGDVFVARYVNSGGGTINDGKLFDGSVIVAKGSSAPYLLGVFHDKTSIEADRTATSCRGNVYFAWSRFTGNGGVAIYFSRSTDHGVTFSTPMKLTAGIHDVQFPAISITNNGHVYVTFRQFASGIQADGVDVVKSTNCGATFSKPKVITTFTAMGLVDRHLNGGRARDCGDAANECQSGFTFFRADTGPRSTSDQGDSTHEWVYVMYEAIVPGTEVSTGTTFGWADEPGAGGQSAIYYLRYNGANGNSTAPQIVAPSTGQQLFPDLAVDAGTIHALFYDSRNDANNTPTTARIRPIGNNAAGVVAPGFDVYASTGSTTSGSWTPAVRLTDVRSNGQYEQFSGRTVPFGGDYLWIDSKMGTTFGVWTDWRDTVPGTDPRYPDGDNVDVLQCRTLKASGSYTGDTCPRNGGLDQNIYGDLAP
ncbi:MAG: sialidase family protein [Candidatus Limnocylindrales bacterium]